MKTLVRVNRPVPIATRKRMEALLDYLGIGYRKAQGQTFWKANSHQMPDLLSELRDEVRDKFRELHPDKGGDAEEFKAFMELWTVVKKQIALHVPVVLNKPTAEVKVLAPGKGLAERRERQAEVYKLYRQAHRPQYRVLKRRSWAKHRDKYNEQRRTKRVVDAEHVRAKDHEKYLRIKADPVRLARFKATNARSARKHAEVRRVNQRLNMRQRRSDPLLKAKENELRAAWVKRNPEKRKANYLRWRHSPKGLAYLARRRQKRAEKKLLEAQQQLEKAA